MYKLLIADDEAIIREGIRCLLDWEALGFTTIDEAANGEQAYELILKNTPDLVLLDIRMPKMTGIELIQQARANGYEGKIVILSGFSEFSYAQQAIRHGVVDYLTKPIDEDELLKIAEKIRTQLEDDQSRLDTTEHYREKAYDTIVKDLLMGDADYSKLNLDELNLNADIYQVVICENYNQKLSNNAYTFSELLRVTNQNHNSYDNIRLDDTEVILLKGNFAIQKFNEFLERYQRETLPQKDSPLDSLFLSYGRPAVTLSEIPNSYRDAHMLICRRFFCEQGQHFIGYESLPEFKNHQPLITGSFLENYTQKLFDAISAFSRGKTAEILEELQCSFYSANDSIDTIKLFFTDLYLQIKERIRHVYSANTIPFPSNADSIRMISEKYYLFEIILFLTEQFEIIMSNIGNSSSESVVDDVLYYINHNYARNITLENIAPLFGYNSSYLGKIFSKKMGENFNTYLDRIRIEHSKEMLAQNDKKVYEIAECVGYRNVDYFHIKFKKYVGKTPAEYRKELKNRVGGR